MPRQPTPHSRIVEPLYVIKDVRPCICSRGVSASIHSLTLEQAKKAIDQGALGQEPGVESSWLSLRSQLLIDVHPLCVTEQQRELLTAHLDQGAVVA